MNNQLINDIFRILQPYCVAIYLGGSHVDPYITNHGDTDIICFADTPKNMCMIRMLLRILCKNDQLKHEDYDFIQVRNIVNEEHSYGSYINKMMIKLIGDDIQFNFDVIGANRAEYIEILKKTILKLKLGKIRNQKRWYQVLRGIYILQNNSYELTERQAQIINIVHDQLEGWEQYKEEALWLYQI